MELVNNLLRGEKSSRGYAWLVSAAVVMWLFLLARDQGHLIGLLANVLEVPPKGGIWLMGHQESMP